MYTNEGIKRAGDRLAAATEDAMFEHTKAIIEAREEWVAATPARIREYNRPINRLRRRMAEYRARIGLAVEVLRGRHDCYYD